MTITVNNPTFGQWTKVRNRLVIASAAVALAASAVLGASSLKNNDSTFREVVPRLGLDVQRTYVEEPSTFILYVVETQEQAAMINRAELDIAMDADTAGAQVQRRSYSVLMADTPEKSIEADKSVYVMVPDLESAGVSVQLTDMRVGR